MSITSMAYGIYGTMPRMGLAKGYGLPGAQVVLILICQLAWSFASLGA